MMQIRLTLKFKVDEFGTFCWLNVLIFIAVSSISMQVVSWEGGTGTELAYCKKKWLAKTTTVSSVIFVIFLVLFLVCR